MAESDSLKPVPDPTALTTVALEREIRHLHEKAIALVENLDTAMKGHWALDMERFASLNVRLDERFKAQQEALHAALAAVDKAMDKAEIASEKRFDGVTSSVQQVNAQTAGYLLREEYASAHSALVGKVDTAQATNNERFREMELRLTSRLDLMQGKGAGLNAGWAYLVAAIGVAAAIITVIIATRP